MRTIEIVLSVLFTALAASLAEHRGIFKPPEDITPFLVYFTSYYRGTCVGTLVGPTYVLTAAVCVATRNSTTSAMDTRPITVVLGTHYRHKMRGVRIPVTRIYITNIGLNLAAQTYKLQHSVAVLKLAHATPNGQGDFAPRALAVDYVHDVNFKEECFTVGWNFYTGYPVIKGKFRLQKTLHMQFLTVEHPDVCEDNHVRFASLMANLGYSGQQEPDHFICLIDPGKAGLPCHGMYGAPLICRGNVMAVMTGPDTLNPNCTDSVLYHTLSHKNTNMRPFLECIEGVFKPAAINFSTLYKDQLQDNSHAEELKNYYDYAGEMGDADDEDYDEE